MEPPVLIPALLSLQEHAQKLVLEDRQHDQDGEERSGEDTDPFQVMLDDAVIRVEFYGLCRQGRVLAGFVCYPPYTGNN